MSANNFTTSEYIIMHNNLLGKLPINDKICNLLKQHNKLRLITDKSTSEEDIFFFKQYHYYEKKYTDIVIKLSSLRKMVLNKNVAPITTNDNGNNDNGNDLLKSKDISYIIYVNLLSRSNITFDEEKYNWWRKTTELELLSEDNILSNEDQELFDLYKLYESKYIDMIKTLVSKGVMVLKYQEKEEKENGEKDKEEFDNDYFNFYITKLFTDYGGIMNDYLVNNFLKNNLEFAKIFMVINTETDKLRHNMVNTFLFIELLAIENGFNNFKGLTENFIKNLDKSIINGNIKFLTILVDIIMFFYIKIMSDALISNTTNVQFFIMEPVKMESVKIEPVKIEPVKIEPVKIEPVKIEPVKIEPVKMESVKFNDKVEELIKIFDNNSLASNEKNILLENLFKSFFYPEPIIKYEPIIKSESMDMLNSKSPKPETISEPTTIPPQSKPEVNKTDMKEILECMKNISKLL
jgi:hypothetical protein